MKPASASMTCILRRCSRTLVCALVLGFAAGAAQSLAQSVNDAQFREAYLRRYQALRGVAPDLVVMELRDRIELVASRGSAVGAASNDRRVRGFESALLQGLQQAVCGGSSAGVGPSPAVVERITAAAASQQLRTQTSDVAELTALVQRMLDSQPRERWCALRSLDDIR
jgi:hypothetical protein